MLEGKDIPQNGRGLDVFIKHYEEFVDDIKNKQYFSLYVYSKDVVSPPDPTTPASETALVFPDSEPACHIVCCVRVQRLQGETFLVRF